MKKIHVIQYGVGPIGAGMVRLSSPGVLIDPLAPTEVVGHQLPLENWAGAILGTHHAEEAWNRLTGRGMPVPENG